MALDVIDIVSLLLIGLFGGLLGGLGGLGGSIIIIPAMAVLFHDRSFDNQHLYQAAAMVVNVFVSIPAAIRHKRSGMVRADLFKAMLPATILTIILGVTVSNTIDSTMLEKCFATFVVCVAVQTIWSAARRRPEVDESQARIDWLRGSVVGGAMGFMAGLLGVGGGVIAVPLARVVCRLPLKKCIAVSAAVMCVTSGFGAAIKLATLSAHGLAATQALLLALVLAPTAMIGGYVGAGLTRSLPLVWVRVVLGVLLLATSAKMVGVW